MTISLFSIIVIVLFFLLTERPKDRMFGNAIALSLSLFNIIWGFSNSDIEIIVLYNIIIIITIFSSILVFKEKPHGKI